MKLSFRFASIREMDVYFKWSNDPVVRQYSYQSAEVTYDGHVEWFKSKLLNPNCYLYFFHANEVPVGQVRIDKSGEKAVIGISVDEQFRGKGCSSKMLIDASEHYLIANPREEINAYIKIENLASYKTFKRAGFRDFSEEVVSGFKSYRLTKRKL